MKTKKFHKKLALNKGTVAHLEDREAKMVKAGYDPGPITDKPTYDCPTSSLIYCCAPSLIECPTFSGDPCCI